jgi:hypothetical protein
MLKPVRHLSATARLCGTVKDNRLEIGRTQPFVPAGEPCPAITFSWCLSPPVSNFGT